MGATTENVEHSDTNTTDDVRLHPMANIMGGTFIGGLLAGAWMIAGNLEQLGRPEQARNARRAGIASFIAVAITFWLLPQAIFDAIPGLFVSGVYTVGIVAWAGRSHGKILDQHRKARRPRISTWKALGITLVSLAITVATVVSAGVVAALISEVTG